MRRLRMRAWAGAMMVGAGAEMLAVVQRAEVARAGAGAAEVEVGRSVVRRTSLTEGPSASG